MRVLRQGKVATVPLDITIRDMPIQWGIPMDETMFTLWFSNWVNLDVMPWDDIAISHSTYLPEARNFVHESFVKYSKLEWLMMLDSDVMPPPSVLQQLLSHGKLMVGGWYRKKGGMNEPVVYDYQGKKEDGKHGWKIRMVPGEGLERVDGAGAGCWLMHRSVAEAIGLKPYDMERGGEDLGLCLKVKEAGFDCWIDWKLACAHLGVGIT